MATKKPDPVEPAPAPDPAGAPVQPTPAVTNDEHGIGVTDPYPQGKPQQPSYAEINGLPKGE